MNMLIYNYINVLNMLKCISRNLLTRVNFTLSTRKLFKKKKKNEITDLSYLEKLIIDESC